MRISLKELRKKAGYTQYEIAEKMACSQSFVVSIEKNAELEEHQRVYSADVIDGYLLACGYKFIKHQSEEWKPGKDSVYFTYQDTTYQFQSSAFVLLNDTEKQNIILQIRKSMDFSQRELSRITNISATSLSFYESGYRKVSFENLFKVAVACGYDEKTLEIVFNKILERRNLGNDSFTEVFDLPDEEIELINKYRALSQQDKTNVWIMALLLASKEEQNHE